MTPLLKQRLRRPRQKREDDHELNHLSFSDRPWIHVANLKHSGALVANRRNTRERSCLSMSVMGLLFFEGKSGSRAGRVRSHGALKYKASIKSEPS